MTETFLIVFSDFSSTGEVLGVSVRDHHEDFAKELGCAISGSIGGIGPIDSDLLGLDPIDLDGLQMLTDQEIITDPATEDHFRLDRS